MLYEAFTYVMRPGAIRFPQAQHRRVAFESAVDFVVSKEYQDHENQERDRGTDEACWIFVVRFSHQW